VRKVRVSAFSTTDLEKIFPRQAEVIEVADLTALLADACAR
jgi:hypothetical protein